MSYTVGGQIDSEDYNGFVNTGSNNINTIWSTGSGDTGWGQTSITTVSDGATVTATQWATLVANLATAGQQTSSTLTARTQPVTGNVIAILANVSADIDTVTSRRGFAAGSGTEYGVFSGTTSKTSGTGSGQSAWTITFTHTITFPSANAARYFWNAGGIVRLKYGKSSTGTDSDSNWNTFAGYNGTINLTGRVNGASQTIAGQAYTGTTRLSGSGGTETTLATTTGWYNLTTSPITIYQLTDGGAYGGEYIRTTATATSSTVLTLVTTWVSDGATGPGTSANISGGSATASPSTTITGDAPTTLVTYIPPSTTYLSNSWGTPTIAASVA